MAAESVFALDRLGWLDWPDEGWLHPARDSPIVQCSTPDHRSAVRPDSERIPLARIHPVKDAGGTLCQMRGGH